jgi:hypothetical protein
MTRKDAILQFLLALIVFSLLSLFIKVPGYMDAEYYTLSAQQIASGKGLTQPVLWNYLDDPIAIPHPSHTYWMPAPSLVASAGMVISGQTVFSTGRIPFIVFAALVAPAAGWMGFHFSRRRLVAWVSSGFSIFCGYYAPYSATVDSFFLVMAGAWIIFFVFERLLLESKNGFLWLLPGLAAGWMHLNRADGWLWLAFCLTIWLFLNVIRKRAQISIHDWVGLFAIFAGYFAVTSFWYYRNWMVFSSLFPPNSTRALWMTNYNELFAYPPESLTYQHWFASGITAILKDRFTALGRNLTVLFAVQGMVFLWPFWLVAIWKRRENFLIRFALCIELIILFVMSFVFPYSGMRGGYLHSSAALQPLFWGLAATGAADTLQWAARKRKWNLQTAEIVLLPGIVVICVISTAFIFNLLVIGSNPKMPAWEESFRSAEISKSLLDQNTVNRNSRVMINNPAGYSLYSDSESLVIPDGSFESTVLAAKKFQTNYLILEKNHVSGLDGLYNNPNGNPVFELLGEKNGTRLYKIIQLDGNQQ